jgi:L,D-transpeptidase catalytic domain
VKRALALAVAVALLAPAAAAGQEPVPPPPPPAPPPAPAPPPPVPQLTLVADSVLRAGGRAVVLRGRSFVVRGAMLPAVAGQQVELRLFRNGKRSRTVRVPVAADGTFARRMPTRRLGRVSVRATHAATPELGAARGPKVSVRVVEPRLGPGAGGPLVRLLQRGLARLHYAVPRNGSFDAATGRAVMAFRKVNRMARRYDADRRVISKVLAGKGAFKPRHPDAGRHVEADLSRQVLALVDGARVVATYHSSSGAPATPTVIGTFRVYLKTPGTNAKGMVHSNYFIRGYAIHGYIDVPAFNASHGCLRIPIPDAWRVFRWLRIGDRVIVYP